MPNGRARKHHYIPQFYLRRWLGPDRQLCELALHNGRVAPHRKPTKSAGFETDLYTLDLGPHVPADNLETKFFARIDDDAAVLLERIVSGNPIFRSQAEVSALSRFIMSLFQRDPKTVRAAKARVQADYDELVAQGRLRARDDPEDANAFEKFLAGDFRFGAGDAMLQLFRSSMDNPRIGNILNGMTWRIADVGNGGIHLMTCDRPVIISDTGLSGPQAMVALPISPSKAMLGFADPAKANDLDRMPPATMARKLNLEVVKQAEKYVYATTQIGLPFVSKHLGKRPIPSIQELLSRGLQKRAASADWQNEISGLDIPGRLRTPTEAQR